MPAAVEQSPSTELTIDTTIYTTEALFRACYVFTDRAYLFLRRSGPDAITVEFRLRRPEDDPNALRDTFANELIDQRLRAIVREETTQLRDWIVAQAFVEADLPPNSPLAHLPAINAEVRIRELQGAE